MTKNFFGGWGWWRGDRVKSRILEALYAHGICVHQLRAVPGCPRSSNNIQLPLHCRLQLVVVKTCGRDVAGLGRGRIQPFPWNWKPRIFWFVFVWRAATSWTVFCGGRCCAVLSGKKPSATSAQSASRRCVSGFGKLGCPLKQCKIMVPSRQKWLKSAGGEKGDKTIKIKDLTNRGES